MSRIGKQHIAVPAKTEITVVDGSVVVKGPLGELRRTFKSDIAISVADGVVTLAPKENPEMWSALWGTYASHIKNMIAGVNKAYEKKLIVEGVGYRAEIKGKDLVMQLGFSHPVTLPVPEGITISIEKNTISLSAIDKELLGQFAATIRSNKVPEPYKGKGIRYSDEVVRRKEGKRAA